MDAATQVAAFVNIRPNAKRAVVVCIRPNAKRAVVVWIKRKGTATVMLYKKYRLFDENVEIMIPSDIKPAGDFAPTENSWMSKDRRVVINAAMGVADLTDEDLAIRLNEYYKSFCKNIRYFECLHVRKRNINRRAYGEIQYMSKITGYSFYNIFLLGSCMDLEFTVTIQCMESVREEYRHVFENISDSIRILY